MASRVFQILSRQLNPSVDRQSVFGILSLTKLTSSPSDTSMTAPLRNNNASLQRVWCPRGWSSSAASPQNGELPSPSRHAGDTFLSSAPESSCWNCNHRFKKGGVICSGCDKIQPLDTSLNYFELLGMCVSESIIKPLLWCWLYGGPERLRFSMSSSSEKLKYNSVINFDLFTYRAFKALTDWSSGFMFVDQACNSNLTRGSSTCITRGCNGRYTPIASRGTPRQSATTRRSPSCTSTWHTKCLKIPCQGQTTL